MWFSMEKMHNRNNVALTLSFTAHHQIALEKETQVLSDCFLAIGSFSIIPLCLYSDEILWFSENATLGV